MNLLVTGGAGYIGSHTCVLLLEAGHTVTVIDNLCNSSAIALERVQELAGKPLRFVEGDIRNPDDLARAFEGGIDAVIHFAALKAVGESCEQPLRYFDNNIGGTIALMQAMQDHGVHHLVFSSSATVYGQPDQVPVTEDAPLRVTNPYGRSKLVMEDLIRDWCAARPEASAVLLRYFNPAGAHPGGRLGEDPRGVPNNLVPYVSQVAAGKLERLQVFGGDYPTRDGTGIRDYIHVMDLAAAHVMAVGYMSDRQGCETFNLGTGHGFSVLEIIRMFERVSGRQVPFDVVGRRPGDIAALTANPVKAETTLGWVRKFDLEDICRDAWRWQKAQAEVGHHPQVILAGRRTNDGMGGYVADQVIKLMVRNGINPVNARALILGLAFKENCPDLRNTRVVDIVHALQGYNTRVDVFDPWVDGDEAHHEYGLRPIESPAQGAYDAIVLAVGHDDFRQLGGQGVRAFGKPEGNVVFDVKYVLPRDAVDGRL